MQSAVGEALEGATRTREAVAALGAALEGPGEAQVSAPALDLGQMTAVANDASSALDSAGRAGRAAGAAIGAGAEAATAALDGTGDAAAAAGERLQDAGRRLAEDTLGPMKAALKSGELSWKSFAGAVAGIAQNLAGRLIDAAFRPIETALVDAVSGGGGSGLAGLVASAFGFARGGAFAQGHELAAFARGGVILPLRRGRNGRLGVEMTAPPSAALPSAAPQAATRIINVIDPGLFVDYVATPAGERAIVNVTRRNRGALGAW